MRISLDGPTTVFSIIVVMNNERDSSPKPAPPPSRIYHVSEYVMELYEDPKADIESADLILRVARRKPKSIGCMDVDALKDLEEERAKSRRAASSLSITSRFSLHPFCSLVWLCVKTRSFTTR